ncbi:DNA helicase [Pseudomonas phage 98PfluR60PP]|uniref:DNA helicase n=1 Tax=Pseudomonas phage 98PfluR60PP TaxID=2163965 RepID=A0A2S1PFZ7_9CAUD|nr:Dda-like helicase [Pseudomonas phage 98PfluR60PP]AWH15445.1 DNA helicase [Pseudomonas phage 98PfluR60PP]
MTDIVYTPGQLKGWEKFASFYLSPLENVMLLKGYAGTGKSTLVRMFAEKTHKLDEMRKLVDPNWGGMTIMYTATTNQAATSLAQAMGGGVKTSTVHTALQLKLITEDYRTKKKKLIPYGEKIRNALIFVDEASYIDQDLLSLIFHQTENCKIVFIGDPAQLTPVGSTFMPAFEMNRNEIELTDLVRFDEGPISTMVSNLRDTVLTNTWHKFQLADGIIEHVSRADFDMLAHRAFTNEKEWGVTKILGYHNDRVVHFNNKLSEQVIGTSELQVGQRVASNTAASNGSSRVYNNEEVLIEALEETRSYGFDGWMVRLANKEGIYFMPKERHYKNEAHKAAVREDDYDAMKYIDEEWVDLRPAFSCTVNKAQGSTYDTAFIDLDDINAGARTANQLARLLYVGNGRCRSRCIMTGDVG